MRSHPAPSSRVRRWPVADRELLILCKDTEHAARGVYESSCASAVNDQLPVGEGRVRAHIHGAKWHFEALPDGRTLIRFKGSIDPMGPLPKWFVGSAQKFVSSTTISGLVNAQKWLGVPPLERFAHWGGGAGATITAETSRGGVRGWCARSKWCPFVRPGVDKLVVAPGPAPVPRLTLPPSTLLLKALLLCAAVSLSAWAARRLSWQGLTQGLLRGAARAHHARARSHAFTTASDVHGASLRKAVSCVQMPCRAAGASHLLHDLSEVLAEGAATPMRRSASAHSRVSRRHGAWPETCERPW